MHKWVMEKAKCLKSELDGVGFDELTVEQKKEAECLSKFFKNMIELEQAYKIVEAMEKEEENEKIMEKIEQYTDYPSDRKFYNTRRYANGEYAPKGRGSYVGRHGYDEPMRMYGGNVHYYNEPDYRMTPEMYRNNDYDELRDMDKHMGRMYYTSNRNMSHDEREGRTGMARVRYYESKEMDDKNMKMQELENYAEKLKMDIREMMADAPTEEKQMMMNKLSEINNMLI